MIKFSEEYVNLFVTDQKDISNGWSLVKQGGIFNLLVDEDETILFGSANDKYTSETYFFYVDFLEIDEPLFSCSCPYSAPCEHSTALMYAWLTGKSFTKIKVHREQGSKRIIKFDEDYVSSYAPDQETIENSWLVLRKDSFDHFLIDEAETLLFGWCNGSGKKPYLAAVDFLQTTNPFFYCTCSSRKLPCKHTLALMNAWWSGKPFVEAEVPAELLEKREKTLAKEEKKRKNEGKPKKVNWAAYQKKLKAQLTGLDLFEQVLHDLVRSGLGTISQKTLNDLEERVKDLGNYYLPGIQKLLRAFIYLFKEREMNAQLYQEAEIKLVQMAMVVKKGKEYLTELLEHPKQALDPTNIITEWLGQAWQFEELKQAGLVKQQVELVQLSFVIFNNLANAEYIDFGQWIDLGDGTLYETVSYRPYELEKHIKAEDSCLAVVQANEMVIYSGDSNRRVRWEEMTTREVTVDDLAKIRSAAESDFQSLTVKVKNILKNPLAKNYPVCLLRYARLGQIGEELVIEDQQGKRLILKDLEGGFEEPTCDNLLLLKDEILQDQILLGRFHYSTREKSLFLQPISLITPTRIIRLV